MRRLLAAIVLWLPVSSFGAAFEPAKLPELTAPITAPAVPTGLSLPPQALINPLSAVDAANLLAPLPPTLPESLTQRGIMPVQTAVGAEIGPVSAPHAFQSAGGERAADLAFGARDKGRWTRTYHSLAELGEDYRRAHAAGVVEEAALADKLFDNSAALAADADDLPEAATPKIPVGVRSVTVDAVNKAGDIGRLIPGGINSDELISQLVEHIDEMGQYRIYTYHSRGDFVGIDLSARPDLVELLPEQQSHEVRLIKKIQAYNQDLRVLVREDGKTPDLIVGGVVTELKSLIGDKVDLTYLVDKANTQVLEHATRHDLGNGAAVIDLTKESQVPVRAVLKELNAWARMPLGTPIPGGYLGLRHLKQEIALDRVTVFAGEDVKVFARGKDGAYQVLEERPFQDFEVSRPKRTPRGKPGKSRQSSGTALADAFEKARILSDLRGFVQRGRLKKALKAWEVFEETHRDDVVDAAFAQAGPILDQIRRKLSRDGKFRRGRGGRRR